MTLQGVGWVGEGSRAVPASKQDTHSLFGVEDNVIINTKICLGILLLSHMGKLLVIRMRQQQLYRTPKS